MSGRKRKTTEEQDRIIRVIIRFRRLMTGRNLAAMVGCDPSVIVRIANLKGGRKYLRK